jgi:hypothetical protein
MPNDTKRIRLGERDYDIFDHLMRYRMTTREVLHSLFFEDSDMNAVTKVTSRLVRHHYLNRHTLYEPRTYFTLGPEAASLFGITRKRTRALGSQALPHEFGILHYCCLAETPRERLRVSEVRPEYLAKGIDSASYYYDNDGERTRLAYMRVDQGGPSAHVIRKCRADIACRRRHPPLGDLIQKDLFLIAVITAHKEKKAMIEHALRQHSWDVRFRVEVVSDLAQLLTR